jgi:hypothetical protein
MSIENYLSLVIIEGYFSVDDYDNITHTDQKTDGSVRFDGVRY